jgi:endonuclease/exonuclease/phosphatase family metal-dependent hydrolase
LTQVRVGSKAAVPRHPEAVALRYCALRIVSVVALSAAIQFGCAGRSGPRSTVMADSTARPTAVDPIRVMSFNIRYGTAGDGEDAWPHRRGLVMRTIGSFRPTVLGVQEALRFQLDEIGDEFREFGEVGVGRDDGAEAGEYAAILYDRRRLELLESGTFWLSDTPEVVASTSWGNRITRIVTWARFRGRAATDADGGTFYVFNTHWDHESQPSRKRSAELLLERIAGRAAATDPVIVTGDFNAGEGNPAFRRLVEHDRAHLVDTFRAVHPDADHVGTFNGFTGERDGDKIDAVLASPEWTVLEASVVRVNEDGRYPSDHFPVTAVLRAADRS